MIRGATPSDLASLVASGLEHDRVRVRLARHAESSETALVADVHGTVLGVLSIRWSRGCDGEDRPWFYGGHVHPCHRSQGLGTALWVAGEDLARRRGATEASLDVEPANVDARRLYERLGWVVMGPHRHRWHAIDPDTRSVIDQGTVDTLAMRKALATR